MTMRGFLWAADSQRKRIPSFRASVVRPGLQAEGCVLVFPLVSMIETEHHIAQARTQQRQDLYRAGVSRDTP